MQQAQLPESAEIDLTEYEGIAVMVRGHEGGDWIYFAGGPNPLSRIREAFHQIDQNICRRLKNKCRYNRHPIFPAGPGSSRAAWPCTTPWIREPSPAG